MKEEALVNDKLIKENELLKQQLEEYKDLVDGIRNGAVDALAINKNGRPDIFTLESTDFVYRVLVENLAESTLNVSDTGLILYANPAFENLVGPAKDLVIGSDIRSFIDPKYKRTFEKLFRNAFSGTSKGEITLRHRNKTKQVHISLSSLYPRFAGIGINITDLSASKLQEEEISSYKSKLTIKEEELLQAEIQQKSIEKFRFMGDTVPQKVWTADALGSIDYLNKKWFEYTGHDFDDLKNLGWQKVVHADDWAETEQRWRAAIDSGNPLEAEHRIKSGDGTYRWHLSRAIAQRDENEEITMWVGTTTDVHEQKNFSKELEKKVHDATVFLQNIFDSSEEAIISFDMGLNFTSLNRVAASFMDAEPHEMIGKNLLEKFPVVENSNHYKTLQKALAGETANEKENVSIKGKEIVFDMYCKPLVIRGDVTGVLVVARDITAITNITNTLISAKQQLEIHAKSIEEKNNELTNANAELRSFTYIASHDLQGPLRKIMIFSGRIMEEQKDLLSEETLRFFERLNLTIAHMQELISALLNYSKMSDNKFTLVQTDLNELVSEVKKEMQELITEKAVVLDISILPTVNIVPMQFSQLFNNLVSNAIKYSREKVSPIIKIDASIVNGQDIVTELPHGWDKYWRISVGDNGIGFDQAYQFKIFELFQRLHTDDEFPGTGIGLAICYKVVQNHNGLMTAFGKPGIGSTFNIYLPLTDGTLS